MKLDRVTLSASLLLCASCTSRSTSSDAAPTAGETGSSAHSIVLPGGEGGIGFDDLRYSKRLGCVLAPAGRTGRLALVDVKSETVITIGGFGSTSSYAGGHGDGTTSVDEGEGRLFAIDRTSKRVEVVDPAAKRIVAGARLAADPDYVRYVAATRELWVTEPDAEQIEVFALSSDAQPVPTRIETVSVPGGPESLVIDGKRGRAYTHLWDGATVVVDLRTRALVARWPNGCKGSRGIALDEARGFLFVGCAEGRAVVLDVDHEGRELSSAATGSGVDIVDYDPERAHLYVPAASGTLTILGVAANGALSVLATDAVAKGAHCATTDGNGRVFVGDPERGRLQVLEDPYPPSGR